MPRVPTYDGFQVAPNTLPQAGRNPLQYSAPQTNVAAQQARQAGQALSQAGGQIGQVALQIQEQANQLRVDEALNKIKEETLRLTHDQEVGYQNIKGVNALERPDGKPLSDEYSEMLTRRVSEIEGGLGNSAQKEMFARAARDVVTSFRGQIMRHEAKEYEAYALSVSEGVQATALNEIALFWNDPETIEKAVRRIQAHTYQQAQLLGKSAEWQEARVRQMTSKAHAQAITSSLEHSDVLYADAYLNKYAGQMEAADILDARSKITSLLDLQVGDNIGAEVFAQFAPDIAPDDFTRLVGIVMGIESGGRRYDDSGNLLEGPETRHGTAKGEMQVLDGTNRDPGFGVRPAKDDSPEERARVGRDYLAAMVKEFDGELSKALAAYNWGPGNVNRAIKEHGTQWLAYAPEETRSYVATAISRYGSGVSSIPKPTLTEMKRELESRPELAGNPSRLKYAQSRLESEYKLLTDLEKERSEQALDAAYRELYANGGNMASLPANVRMAIPGEKLSSVISFAEKVSRNEGHRHSPEMWAKVLSMPNELLAQMSPIEFYEQFRPYLDDAHLEKGYALLATAQGEPTDKHLEIISTATRVKHGAMEAGIIPANGSPSKSQEKEFAEYQRVVDEKVRQFERMDLQGKRRANSEELQRIIDEVNMDTVKLPRWYWSDRDGQLVSLLDEGDYESAYVEVDGEDITLSEIPAEQRARITQALKSRGMPVTELAIAQLWVEAGKPR